MPLNIPGAAQSLRVPQHSGFAAPEAFIPVDSARLLVEAQSSNDPNNPARQQLWPELTGLVHTFAAKACRFKGMPLTEVDDIVSATFVSILKPGKNRFDPSRCPSPTAYLNLLVRNAASARRRFLNRAAPARHDYSDPRNAKRHLPASSEAVPAPLREPDLDTRDLAAKVRSAAGPKTRRMVDLVYWEGRTFEEAGRDAGVDRRTVSRHLGQLAKRAAEQFASVLSG